MLDWRCSGGGKGQLGQDGWFEDSLRSDQGDSDALEVEAALEDGAREGGVAEASSLLGEEVEGAQADRGVAVVSHGSRNR